MSQESCTITYLGVEMEIEADYTPAESQTHYNPGCDSELDIYSISIKGVECVEMFSCLQEMPGVYPKPRDCLDEIRTLCWEQLERNAKNC